MATKRKTYRFRHGDIVDVEEFHDGRYGGPGKKRDKKAKPTVEQMREVNAQNKARRCRQRMLEYFSPGDCFATWTYEIQNRPPNMGEALKEFQKAMRYVRKEYKKRGRELFWIRNIERGTKGAWHIHLIVNEIGDTASILQRAWKKGGTWSIEIRISKYYDEDFSRLSNYMTKDEYKKADGTPGKPRLKEANYNTSRNMPLPKPDVDILFRWKVDPKPKKGYYIARIHEGINPATGFKYRRYTMIRLNRRDKSCLRYTHT
ncbi:rolling circle replication-associated protein [Diplocloster hominis]|uniref:rolling circle replication-associated protein n=1 Tax=Diplocloster hominis TaxID=3079010 RepID=UPI0031BB4C5A